MRLMNACRPSVTSSETFTIRSSRRISVTGTASANKYPHSAYRSVIATTSAWSFSRLKIPPF